MTTYPVDSVIHSISTKASFFSFLPAVEPVHMQATEKIWIVLIIVAVKKDMVQSDVFLFFRHWGSFVRDTW